MSWNLHRWKTFRVLVGETPSDLLEAQLQEDRLLYREDGDIDYAVSAGIIRAALHLRKESNK